MKTKLQFTADKMNEKLNRAGRGWRWEMDTEACSNSCGTWFCGNLGGVTDARSMREHTSKLVEPAKNQTKEKKI
jgi:hypothetical protein